MSISAALAGCWAVPAEIQPFRKTPEPDEADIHKPNLERIFARVGLEGNIWSRCRWCRIKIGRPCCVQFVMTRGPAKKRTGRAIRDWLLKTDEDDITARVFEFT